MWLARFLEGNLIIYILIQSLALHTYIRRGEITPCPWLKNIETVNSKLPIAILVNESIIS